MANVRKFLRKSDAIVGLYDDLKKMPRIPGCIIRIKPIREYLRANKVKKLMIGAGPTSLPGGLCTDLAPRSDGVLHLDVTKPFPFDSEQFDYVSGEHLIEHLSWNDGRLMLSECYRVLKPGGIVRIATPDLAVFLDLYTTAKTPEGKKYIRWVTDTFLGGVVVEKPQFVINTVFRNWGHQFLYDGEMLELALREAGFKDPTRCKYGESIHEHLRGIECHGSNDGSTEMAIYETMVYEAKRPE
jgi:predicted SAM-dependent methyltransferase